MTVRNVLIISMMLFITACARTMPLQPNDPFYNATLRVSQPYEVSSTLLTMGYHLPAADYKAYMKDNNGVYFSSPTPLIGIDPILGSLSYTGGLYYRMSQKQISYYVINTSGFGEAHVSSKPLPGLNYRILQ